MLRSAGLVGAGLVAGLVIAGLATADASAPARPAAAHAQATASPAPGERPDEGRKRDKGDRPGGKDGKDGKGDKGIRGLGRAVHGEVTVRGRDGGYRVLAGQRGVVTALSATSLTVRSEDGFTRTYVRDAATRVADGIAVGDAVRVLAAVENGTARALHVRPGPGKR